MKQQHHMAVIVVIPYRDRAAQLSKLIPNLLKRKVDRIVVCEQTNGTGFNRGWCKNVGFLLSGAEPEDTVYFHDVDLLPGRDFQRYPRAVSRTVRHLYGHYHCLGGIVGMQARDFRTVNGFCNDIWQWGGEDRLLSDACLAKRMHIDRTQFVKRFSRDSYVGEMGSDGLVVPRGIAQTDFRLALQNGAKTVPDVSNCLPQLDKTTWKSVTEKNDDGCPQILHCVVRPREKICDGLASQKQEHQYTP